MAPLKDIEKSLEKLEKELKTREKEQAMLIKSCFGRQQTSAKNLIHYLALRNIDIRDLQEKLHEAGLSSLASSESHILRQIQAIRERLGIKYLKSELSICNYTNAKKIIHDKSELLFGPKNQNQIPFIMVTMDSANVGDDGFIKKLLMNGMNVARINCAHDDEKTWLQIIETVRKVSSEHKFGCKIYMDLAGPKIRTHLSHAGKEKGKTTVRPGDHVWLTEKKVKFKKYDIVVNPNEKEIIKSLKVGERVFFDDGLIEGSVDTVFPEKIRVNITRVSGQKTKLKTGKGINFPDSVLDIASLTDFDIKCLPFIVRHSDMIGYSFVRTPADVLNLHKAIQSLGMKKPNIILKIETPEAVINLPSLLFAGMQEKVFGIMIARGDLAVEIGFERMGEIQEEILWICEAAHTPVIWATQVLESMHKSGMATRSEITDAAHAAMAECVMINKGDYTVEVIETLKEILFRMGGHHVKKRHIFRPLNIAGHFFVQS